MRSGEENALFVSGRVVVHVYLLVIRGIIKEGSIVTMVVGTKALHSENADTIRHA